MFQRREGKCDIEIRKGLGVAKGVFQKLRRSKETEKYKYTKRYSYISVNEENKRKRNVDLQKEKKKY